MDVLASNHLLGARTHPLSSGDRVRLRLTLTQDGAAIDSLLREAGSPIGELDMARLVRADPRRQITICASALIGSRETILGVGSMALGSVQPELLVTRFEDAEELEWLLGMALSARAAAITARLAA